MVKSEGWQKHTHMHRHKRIKHFITQHCCCDAQRCHTPSSDCVIAASSESMQEKAKYQSYLQDLAPLGVTVDVLTGMEHSQRHTVQQDHQHGRSLKPGGDFKLRKRTKMVRNDNSQRFLEVKDQACFSQ